MFRNKLPEYIDYKKEIYKKVSCKKCKRKNNYRVFYNGKRMLYGCKCGMIYDPEINQPLPEELKN